MAKCAEGGFLAVRNIETRNLEEVEFELRQSGNLSGRYHYIPICFAMVVDFGEELKQLRNFPENATRQNEIGEEIWPKWGDLRKTVFSKERTCEPFTRWQQGFTPKEHIEMINRKEMLEWQEKQEKRHSRDEWFRYIFLAVITLVSVALGIFLGHFIH